MEAAETLPGQVGEVCGWVAVACQAEEGFCEAAVVAPVCWRAEGACEEVEGTCCSAERPSAAMVVGESCS
jgi:hypothetical protein